MTQHAASPEAMYELGLRAGTAAAAGEVYVLIGGLGAGKTHWSKGFVAGAGSPADVTSPTFGLVHEYTGGKCPVFHFDFYRLENAEALYAIGWDEYLESDGIIIAEWGDRFPEAFPQHAIQLNFTVEADGGRSIQRSN